MATPTFIAGACVVIVATLAYGTTQTHLLYSGMPPACQAASCSATGPGGSNGVTLKTSARPGLGDERAHDADGAQTPAAGGPSTPGRAQQTSTPSPGPGAPPSQTVTPPPPLTVGDGEPGLQVAIWFKALKTWDGGFLAEVTVVNHGRTPLAGWQLWLRYRVTQVDHVWGARFFPQDTTSRSVGMMAPPPRQPPVRAGGSERFTFKASGPLGAPAGCEFDGYTCGFRTVASGTQSGSPQGRVQITPGQSHALKGLERSAAAERRGPNSPSPLAARPRAGQPKRRGRPAAGRTAKGGRHHRHHRRRHRKEAEGSGRGPARK
jgi:hypothetical protein